MGVEVDRRRYEKQLAPMQKFRAGVFVVMATLRMKKLEQQWRGVRQMGDELKGARARLGKQVRTREV